MNMRKLILSLILLFCAVISTFACTSFVVSGKATPDGRPLLLKNRDTGNLNNLVALVNGERYTYIGIFAANDKEHRHAWSGHNEKGFAIMNTAAYNLNGNDGDSDGDGLVIRRALEICATLADFEHLLDTLPRPMDVNANFGVIDAHGGAAYYETGHNGFVKFDANDPMVAPNGYLVRTNFGFSGDHDLDQGVERFAAISSFMQSAYDLGKINIDYLLTNVPHYLTHGTTKLNLYDYMPENEEQTTMFPFRDFIPRYQTASAQLFQGVRDGENPLLTVAWTYVGSPLCTVAIPLCITPSKKLPVVVLAGKNGDAPLTKAGLTLKERLFPQKRGNGKDYINLAALINRQGTGILQQLEPLEDEIIKRAKPLIHQMYRNGNTFEAWDSYYTWVDKIIMEEYQTKFGLLLEEDI